MQTLPLRKKCPYSGFLWLVFSRIRTEFVFSPNAGKYGPEKLRIPTPFTQYLVIKVCDGLNGGEVRDAAKLSRKKL